MDLVRQLLLLIESQSDDSKELVIPASIDKTEALYHLKLLEQAGYTENTVQGPGDNVLWIYSSITWEGQEFLSAIKNDTVWNKVKQEALEKGGAIPFEILKSLALQLSAKLFLG